MATFIKLMSAICWSLFSLLPKKIVQCCHEAWTFMVWMSLYHFCLSCHYINGSEFLKYLKHLTALRLTAPAQLIEAFSIERGLWQGDTLSTILFNTVLEKVIRNIEINPKGTIFNRMRQYIAYADGVLIIGRFVRAIEEVVTWK